MTDEINRIRARLKCAAEGYSVHVGCGGECTPIRPDHDRYECDRCERVVPFREVVDPPCGDYYVRDVGRLLLLLDEGEVRENRWRNALVLVAKIVQRHGCDLDDVPGFVRETIERYRCTLSTLIYWHDKGHIDESWWDDAKEKLHRHEEPKP